MVVMLPVPMLYPIRKSPGCNGCQEKAYFFSDAQMMFYLESMLSKIPHRNHIYLGYSGAVGGKADIICPGTEGRVYMGLPVMSGHHRGVGPAKHLCLTAFQVHQDQFILPGFLRIGYKPPAIPACSPMSQPDVLTFVVEPEIAPVFILGTDGHGAPSGTGFPEKEEAFSIVRPALVGGTEIRRVRLGTGCRFRPSDQSSMNGPAGPWEGSCRSGYRDPAHR